VNHSLRLAEEHALDNDIMGLALNSTPANMIKAARIYETRGQPSQAVLLYQKAGCQTRALELCFNARLFDALCKIADDLDASADPAILNKCAEFFMQHQQHSKAVHLLSMAKQYDSAVQLCHEHDVPLTEEMAEMMTPDKTAMETDQRADLLFRIAHLCKQQGLFQLACKKFTQAGDKTRAMKSLLNSGDTEKIVFFAGTARQGEIYILAANYLQSLDAQHKDPEVMKNIINFYTKAKAYNQLAGYYESCAQVEIDEYQNYDKAAAALKESIKYVIKAVGSSYDEQLPAPQVENLKRRAQQYELFSKARTLSDEQTTSSNVQQAIQMCEQLLKSPDIAETLRLGDVFAQMVKAHVTLQNWNEAYQLLQRMRDQNCPAALETEMIAKICHQAGGINPFHGDHQRVLHEEDEIEED